jgi:hypothetical protein
MNVEFEADGQVFTELGREVASFMRSTGEALGQRAQELEREEAPERTGVLKETVERIRLNEPDGYAEQIEPLAFYRDFVIGGTGLFGPRKQRIYPKKSQALRFVFGGRVVFARSVKGQQPNPFVSRAYRRLRKEESQIIDRQFREFFG